MKTLVMLLVGALGVLAAEGNASATHKSWVLKNSGSDCTFTSTHGSERYDSNTLYNEDSYSRVAECPVALSARWGNSATPAVSPALWGAAMSANVYVATWGGVGQPVTCKAVGQTWTGALLYSNSKTVNGNGSYQTVMVNFSNNWGGTLESNNTDQLNSLDFECSVPSGGVILGYKVKICQERTDCDDMSGPPNYQDNELGSSDQATYIQTSGIDCVAISSSPDVTRSVNGITNSGTDWTEVVCPFALAADDSKEHPRSITKTHVYYSGAPAYPGCAGAATCPQCNLQWVTRTAPGDVSSTMAYQSGGLLEYGNDPLYAALAQTSNDRAMTSYEVNAGLDCWLPPGATLKGATAIMTLTEISQGR